MMANAKVSRPKLDENGDPIFELNNYVFLPDLPPNLHESLVEEYTYIQHTLYLLRDLWFVQFANPEHRNYWNIRAAYDFWTEHGPETFNGGRKLGWWYEGEGEGEEEAGVGIGGNWITWGIERLEGDLMDIVIKNGRRFRKVRRKKASERLRSERTVKIVEFHDADAGVGDDAEMISLGSMKDMFPSEHSASDNGSVLPGSPISLRTDGGDSGVGHSAPSAQMININQETDEPMADYPRGRDLDADGDCQIVEAFERNADNDVFIIDQETIHGSENPNKPADLELTDNPALRPRKLPRLPNHKRELSPESESDGGILIKDPSDGTYGPVRKSPKRSAGSTASTKNGEARDPICVSSRSSSGNVQPGDQEIIEV